jgi:NTE family protein
MPKGYVAPDVAALLQSSAIFAELSNDERAEIWSRARFHSLLRGEILVRQNTPSNAVYMVVSGRFEVWTEGRDNPVTEIGVGEPIGEIGFFSGGPRTATIVATRDSIVLELDRASFDDVARRVPAIYQTVVRALARRLADAHPRLPSVKRAAAARTVAVIAGGRDAIPPAFFDRLGAVIGRSGKGLLLRQEFVDTLFPGAGLDEPGVSGWLNTIENEYELIAYVTDAALTGWTRKAIRQADQVLVVVTGTAGDLNSVESFAFKIHPPARRRLVLLHPRRTVWVEGTADWLRLRDVHMHHHVALQDEVDIRSLHRFLTGHALGYVAAGGGGFGVAHIGIYKAFVERGVFFDILGGTSAGAAVVAGFALGLPPEAIDLGIHDTFVTNRAFKRFTLPRYAVLDHLHFDDALQRQYKGIAIEDAWRPYFAVATLLDGSSQGPHVIRCGPMWKAVRASVSLPAILPPVFTDDGRILVDGGVIDNIPLRSMQSLKVGPNLVVHFGARETQRFEIDYANIPGRWGLIRRMLTPSGRRTLPAVPGPIGVLERCLSMNQNPDLLPAGPLDLVLNVPPSPGVGFMDFDRHTEVFEAAYEWCLGQIDALEQAGNPALTAILATKA